jgi:hypothetical protein
VTITEIAVFPSAGALIETAKSASKVCALTGLFILTQVDDVGNNAAFTFERSFFTAATPDDAISPGGQLSGHCKFGLKTLYTAAFAPMLTS